MEMVTAIFGGFPSTFLIGLITLFLFLWYSSRNHSYWKIRNVPFVKPYPLIGSYLENFFTTNHEVEQNRYKKYGFIYGHYEGSQPALSVADPKLLRNLFVKDFQFFTSRREMVLSDTYMKNTLVNLTGEEWRRVRSIVTPAFTTGKLKRMIGIFKECSAILVQNLEKAAGKKKPIDVKKFFGTMTLDVIASSAFSTKIDSHNDPDNKFVQMAKKPFGLSIVWRFTLNLLVPKLMKFLGISLFPPDVLKYFREVILQIIEERKRLGQTRDDLLQLLLDTGKGVEKAEQCKDSENQDIANNYGEVADQKMFASSERKSLTNEEIAAQCMVFFFAGYDTVANTVSFATYLFALNPDVQEKACQEIRNFLQESKGDLSYEVIQKMKYLDNAISETLRLYPPAVRMERKADADYKLGDTGLTIPKGMLVTSPTYAIQRDPKYFPDPETFNPDRFTPEERAKRDPFVYMPFGAGPRNCIGMRFALLQVKVCLIHVINYFSIKTCPQTKIPLKFYPSIGFSIPKDIKLEMEPRTDSIPIK